MSASVDTDSDLKNPVLENFLDEEIPLNARVARTNRMVKEYDEAAEKYIEKQKCPVVRKCLQALLTYCRNDEKNVRFTGFAEYVKASTWNQSFEWRINNSIELSEAQNALSLYKSIYESFRQYVELFEDMNKAGFWNEAHYESRQSALTRGLSSLSLFFWHQYENRPDGDSVIELDIKQSKTRETFIQVMNLAFPLPEKEETEK